MKTKLTLFSFLILHSSFCLSGFAQGSLTPPAGPPAPVMKTLEQLEPRIPIGPDTTPGDNDGTPSCYKITQPGSYYLTTNLVCASGKKYGIEVVAANVTIDLNGFKVVGIPDSWAGVHAPGAGHGLKLRNGSIRSWGTTGVLISANDSQHEDLRLSNNGIEGLKAIYPRINNSS